MFPPDRVLAITNTADDILYEERDYLVDHTTGRLTRPADPRMPWTSRDELYPRVNCPEPPAMLVGDDTRTGLLFGEATSFIEGWQDDRNMTVPH